MFFSFFINAQIDFEAHIIVDAHPDVSGPFRLLSADIDGDGDKDLIATSIDGDNVVWFQNLDGQGNFSEPKILTSNMDYPLGIAVADIDADGDLDIIAASNNDFKIAWFENTDGLGNFSPLKLIAISHSSITVQAKDMDGDGDIDLIAGGLNRLIWLENVDGLGTFGPEIRVTNELIYTEEIQVSDMDGDGDMDVVVADALNRWVVWYENTDGQATFGPRRVISNYASLPQTVATKDIDNDDDLDVVSLNDDNYLSWFENTDGLGNFSAPPNVIDPNLGFAYKLCVDDLDGDGNNDIIAALSYLNKVIWLKNDGTGNFDISQIIYSGYYQPVTVIADDFNGDGKMDVAMILYTTDQIIWFENRGPLSIEENTATLFSIYPNPTNGVLNINSSSTVSEITVYNNLGQLFLTSEEKNQIDISTLNEGIYFVKISNQNGQTETKKVIKK